MNARTETPQGLKPASSCTLGGTAEAVPFPDHSDGKAVPVANLSDRAAGMKEIVRQKYGEAALRVSSGRSSC